uniref:Uncharacterized protein n=1 Tax=Xiphophorus couchianus TaxID=32473 RepID=A0A3B5LP45_9TELE
MCMHVVSDKLDIATGPWTAQPKALSRATKLSVSLSIRPVTICNTMIEIGAAFIHGPSEENPVFCLARDYNLLDPKSLTPENQAVDVGEDPPLVPNWFTSSGERISKHVLFHVILDNTPESKSDKQSWSSVGDFVKSEVHFHSGRKIKKYLLIFTKECCASATHSLEDLDLIGFSMYLSIKGVDCTFPRFAHTLDQKQLSPE